MSSTVQIVPKYLQSGTETYIYDNTESQETVEIVSDNSIKLMAVFRSGEGIDNKFIKKVSVPAFKKSYGGSDYKKYGQPIMNAYNALKSGKCDLYCMRVLPSDATYANVIISALYKEDRDNKQFIIKYVAEFTDAAKSDAEFAVKMASLRSDDPDGEGFIKIPLLRVRPAGRGNYGNNYRIRISHNEDYEKNYKTKFYSYDILSTKLSLSSIQSYVGCIVTSTKYKSSTLINDVIDDYEEGESYVTIYSDEDAVEELYDAFKKFVLSLDEADQDPIPALDEFDPLFGLVVNGGGSKTNKNIKIDTESDGAIALDRADGIPLSGGSDGAFETTNTQDSIEQAIEKVYCDAFEGNLDPYILSNKRVPTVAYIDANYPYKSKLSLYKLGLARNDGEIYIDTGIISSKGAVITAFNDYAVFNTRNVSKNFQHYKVRDDATNKKVPVTITYFLAGLIPTHYGSNDLGRHIPMVKEYCTLSGHIKNSLAPDVETCDKEFKELLTQNRFNYFETFGENEFVRNSQNTGQLKESDLLEENNMAVLFEAKGIIEDDINRKLFNFTDPSERQRFKEYEEAKFAPWENKKVSKISIDFTANAWEQEHSIIHCNLSIVYRDLAKRGIIEIDINKRTSSL